MMAKTYVCDTRQGLHVGGCGAATFRILPDVGMCRVVSGSGVGTPTVEGESPVHEGHGGVCGC